MNYSNQILENKMFNIIKEVLYNIMLAVCIMLVGVLILVWGFKFQLNNVWSDSQAPYFTKGDMVIIKAKNDYEVGDIVKFIESDGTPVTHRLVCVHKTGGQTYYICHGDNVQSTMWGEVPTATYKSKWEDEAEYIKTQLETGAISINDLKKDTLVQVVSRSQIEGEIVNHIKGMGYVVEYIQEHKWLLIALVGAIWCVSFVVKNELEIKRSLRLF